MADALEHCISFLPSVHTRTSFDICIFHNSRLTNVSFFLLLCFMRNVK